MDSNFDYVVKEMDSSPGESNEWTLCYLFVSKPGYKVVEGEYGWECKEKKGAPGGETIPSLVCSGPYGETISGLTTSHKCQPNDPSREEGLLVWDPKKLNTTEASLGYLNDLKIASTCEYMRRVGEGVPEWVEVADRHEGDWMVPCVVLEGGAIVYPKSPKGELVQICEDDVGMVAPPCAWTSSPTREMYAKMYEMYGSGVVSEDLLKSAIHVIKVASKVSPPAEAAEVDDVSSESSEKPKRKADAPAAEKPEKKPKADSAVEKEAETTSTSSPSARPEVVDLTKEDD